MYTCSRLLACLHWLRRLHVGECRWRSRQRLVPERARGEQRLASNAHSDQMALLRAFQAWQRACTDNNERQFCARHRLSSATLRLILDLRTQILGQVRATGFIRPRGSGDIRDLNANRCPLTPTRTLITQKAHL